LAHEVRIQPAARRQIRNLPRQIQPAIVAAIEALAGDPRPSGVKKLTGSEDLYRIRVGDYRMIYQVRDDELLVLVARVAHRKDAYR
jgi:mRNA interferase RelE/StbE